MRPAPSVPAPLRPAPGCSCRPLTAQHTSHSTPLTAQLFTGKQNTVALAGWRHAVRHYVLSVAAYTTVGSSLYFNLTSRSVITACRVLHASHLLLHCHQQSPSQPSAGTGTVCSPANAAPFSPASTGAVTP